jgi:hypothetical protein
MLYSWLGLPLALLWLSISSMSVRVFQATVSRYSKDSNVVSLRSYTVSPCSLIVFTRTLVVLVRYASWITLPITEMIVPSRRPVPFGPLAAT